VANAELFEISAAKAAGEIARGALSAEQYTRAFVDRIAAVERDVQAFIQFDPGHALAQARALDRQCASGRPLGPLHGIPVAIKDIFDTEDYPTCYGSPIYAEHRPRADAVAVARLRAAGVVIIGKTVSTEFAYFHPGKTRNPHDLTRTPGGSSSGSAAAVAAGMAPLAIGSQTNGSMIRPAAFCGVFGIKPTHGAISRAGALMLSRALDHVGAFARRLEDLALILDVLVGCDSADPDAQTFAAPAFRATLAAPAPAQHFALLRTPMWDKADAVTRAQIEESAKKLGAADVELPAEYTAGWEAQRVVMAVDMAHNLGQNLDKGEVSGQFRSFIEEGRQVPAVQYLAALRDARRYAAGLGEILQRVDAIVTPSARGVAPSISATGDPVFCSLWSLTGLPSLNMPVLSGENEMPIGLQLIGAAGGDERLLRTARTALERLGFGTQAAAKLARGRA
jgi:Asp-tRNA(Asn)/Glu-tRNA(Gln) amidotransferase A subunit family amidase